MSSNSECEQFTKNNYSIPFGQMLVLFHQNSTDLVYDIQPYRHAKIGTVS
ncbi:hypothetical protein EJK50_0154 [Moraxella catarrhalis]|nr:hypothetical protein EJK50_0154 [Moraxella catarrhalis]